MVRCILLVSSSPMLCWHLDTMTSDWLMTPGQSTHQQHDPFTLNTHQTVFFQKYIFVICNLVENDQSNNTLKHCSGGFWYIYHTNLKACACNLKNRRKIAKINNTDRHWIWNDYQCVTLVRVWHFPMLQDCSRMWRTVGGDAISHIQCVQSMVNGRVWRHVPVNGM